MVNVTPQIQQVGVINSLVPAEGPKVLTVPLPFGTATIVNVDLTQAYENKSFSFVQCLYLDNSLNASGVTLSIQGTAQTFTCPPGSIGAYSVIAAIRAKMTFQSAGGVNLNALLLNVPLPADVWYGVGQISGGGGGTISGTVVSEGQYLSATPTLTAGAFLPLLLTQNGALVTDDVATVPQGSTTAGEMGQLVQGMAILAQPTYAAGTTNPLTLTLAGLLRTGIYNTSGQSAVGTTTALPSGAGLNLYMQYIASPPALVSAQNNYIIADAYGSLFVDTECNSPTYSAATTIAVGATPTDIFTLSGSATKTIRVHEVTIAASATVAGAIPVNLTIRTTANSGGTTAAVGIVAHDQSSAAATAVPLKYTANPTTPGTPAGDVEQVYMNVPAAGANIISFRYGASQGDQSVVLRGANQFLCVDLAGAALLTGELMRVKVKWSEI